MRDSYVHHICLFINAKPPLFSHVSQICTVSSYTLTPYRPIHHLNEKQTLSMTWCTFELTGCKRVNCDCLRVCHTYNFSIFLHPSSSYLGSNELYSDSWVPSRPWTVVGGRRNSWLTQIMKENMFVWYPLYQLSISRSVDHW